MATLKLQSNGPLYGITVIGTLAIDGRAVTFGTARRGLDGLEPTQSTPLLTVPDVTASVPTSYYLMWHYNCLWTLNGYGVSGHGSFTCITT